MSQDPMQKQKDMERINALIGHLGGDDVFVRACLSALRYGADPVEILCQTIIAQCGAIGANQKTLMEMLRTWARPTTIG